MPITTLAKGTKEPQREQPEERSAPAQVGTVLTVEAAGVAARILGARVALGPTRPAAALAFPVHRCALAREPGAMAEKATTQ